jgi:hypothetical protein
MKNTIFNPQSAAILLCIFAVLSWMGSDQLQDEAKTAEVMAEISNSPMVKYQNHPSELLQIEGEGRYTALTEQIALNTEHQQ